MNPKITEVIDKIEKSSIRERGLVLLSCIAVVYLLWDFALYTPIASASAKLDKQLLEKEESIATLKKEEKILMLTLGNDPDKDLRVLLESMNKRKEDLDKNLEKLSQGLVPVEALTIILQEVLKKTGNLVLESLQTLPVEKLNIVGNGSENSTNRTDKEKSENSDAEDKTAGIYKHGVSLVVKGTYFQLLAYLHQLEEMPSHFYWDELHYEQEKYPNGFFQLKVYTLTTEEGLSGV